MESGPKGRFRTFYAGIGKGGFCAKLEKGRLGNAGKVASIVQNGRRLSRHSTRFRSYIGISFTETGLGFRGSLRPVVVVANIVKNLIRCTIFARPDRLDFKNC
jgi:hypothetical protein